MLFSTAHTTSSSTTTTTSTGYTNGNLMTKIFTLVKKKGVETAALPLEVLKAATEVIPVPALKPATDIMLSILDKVYQSQQNSGTARDIANLCFRAHSTLLKHLQSVEITPPLLDSIQLFVEDLHDAQESVEKYKQKNWIQHFVYSRSNNDGLQRLEKRVNNTLSLFQIKELLSLENISMKIYASVQHVEQSTAGNNAYLQRIEQNTVELMNRPSEPAPRLEGASVDTMPGGHITLCEEITNGPGYSLQKAEMGKKAVVIKVFTGCRAKSMWEAAVKSESTVMHPNRPHVIEISGSDECVARYLVYDLDIKDRIEGVILSWMCQEVDEAMYMCAGMIHGISSFDILWDARGRVVLSLRPETTSSSTAWADLFADPELELLHVMDSICTNIFRTVNRIRYVGSHSILPSKFNHTSK
ncbi:hypothetical protein ARMGADRAFT_456785 [Armillaria gallica]|uniref:Mixed lineage kinase domain-containing protein n=1 Tax=Armillaria gallica TaxID=47427 RepID=A0A2H3CWT2_ARMGA|nr:hypothetical protein ARMGADRAFT_456785 [Armillaria gallica]